MVLVAQRLVYVVNSMICIKINVLLAGANAFAVNDFINM